MVNCWLGLDCLKWRIPCCLVYLTLHVMSGYLDITLKFNVSYFLPLSLLYNFQLLSLILIYTYNMLLVSIFYHVNFYEVSHHTTLWKQLLNRHGIIIHYSQIDLCQEKYIHVKKIGHEFCRIYHNKSTIHASIKSKFFHLYFWLNSWSWLLQGQYIFLSNLLL